MTGPEIPQLSWVFHHLTVSGGCALSKGGKTVSAYNLQFLGQHLASILVMLCMPDDLAFDKVDDLFGYIGRMIGQAFQMP